MSSELEVSALAINVVIPEELRWTDTRRGETFMLTTLNVRLLPDGHLSVPDKPELAALVSRAGSRAGELWAAHRGLG